MPSRAALPASRRTLITAARNSTGAGNKHVSSQNLVRAALNISSTSPIAPPTFLLPLRAKLHRVATKQAEATSSSQFQNPQADMPPSMLSTTEPIDIILDTTSSSLDSPTTTAKPLVLSRSVQSLLPHMTAQNQLYITAHVHRFPYLLTAGDTLRLPFHMHGVSPGDIIRLNRASIIGSRDYTLKAGTNSTESYDRKRTGEPNYLDERLFECRVRVLGVDATPLSLKEKTKRRNRRVKTVKSKHRYTVLKVMEVRMKGLDELRSEPGTLLLEGQDEAI